MNHRAAQDRTGLGFVLDSGALIALETPAKQRRLYALLETLGEDQRIVVSAGSVAEVWRGSPRQAPLVLLLRRQRTIAIEITVPVAKAIGVFLGRNADGDDLVDAHVVMLAREYGFAAITSDPKDLLAIDPRMQTVAI
ncbi:MAG TPA: type II toxin-antitoxin system VapC family toxin [Mycobacteriales bacterium]|nr:type II toxin-antitoxin system VapC family toxin [Mycobacteriales bacterium]